MHEYQSPDITKLAKALLAVQTQLQPALKDAENPFTKSNYATLNSVMDACRDALLTNGIWLTQHPVPAPEHLGGGYLGLVTKLTHAESGQWQSSLAVVPLPKADPQGMGSAITYARRYALCAMLGMVTEDDDGEGAKMRGKQAGGSRRPRNAPQAQNVLSDTVAYLWENTKWYDDFSEVRFIESLLQELDGVDFLFIRAGEDSDDTEMYGTFWENPLDMRLTRGIVFS